jgi:hypothetical protein
VRPWGDACQRRRQRRLIGSATQRETSAAINALASTKAINQGTR